MLFPSIAPLGLVICLGAETAAAVFTWPNPSRPVFDPVRGSCNTQGELGDIYEDDFDLLLTEIAVTARVTGQKMDAVKDYQNGIINNNGEDDDFEASWKRFHTWMMWLMFFDGEDDQVSGDMWERWDFVRGRCLTGTENVLKVNEV